MIFEIHNEGKIAYKRLSDADLKRSETSHQTHIGLSNDILTYMPDEKRAYTAMLIYEDYCDVLRCEIAKILRASGRKDATNIKTGGRNEDNVVGKIRSFAKEMPRSDFYLVWFGLDSLMPVFWLIREGSNDFNLLDNYCGFSLLKDRKIEIVKTGSLNFHQLLNTAQKKIEKVTLNLQKELEFAVEIEKDTPQFKDADVKKVRSYINELGKAGENLINEFLDLLKHKKIIEDYEWANKSGEQGKPFDFFIQQNNGNQQWIDVKTTEHEFEQSIIVSKNEVRFITEKKKIEYAVFRVYSKKETEAKLKVCTDCLDYMKKLYRDIDYMANSMSDYGAAMVNYKIAVEPGVKSFHRISSEMPLPYYSNIIEASNLNHDNISMPIFNININHFEKPVGAVVIPGSTENINDISDVVEIKKV